MKLVDVWASARLLGAVAYVCGKGILAWRGHWCDCIDLDWLPAYVLHELSQSYTCHILRCDITALIIEVDRKRNYGKVTVLLAEIIESSASIAYLKVIVGT